MRKLLLLALLFVPTLVAQDRDEYLQVFPKETEENVSITPEPPPTCPCNAGAPTVLDYQNAHCVPTVGPPPGGGVPSGACNPPPGNPAQLVRQCDPGGANPPWNMVILLSNTAAGSCDFSFQNCDAGFPCTPVVDFDSGNVTGLSAAEVAECDAVILNSGFCE